MDIWPSFSYVLWLITFDIFPRVSNFETVTKGKDEESSSESASKQSRAWRPEEARSDEVEEAMRRMDSTPFLMDTLVNSSFYVDAFIPR